MVVFLFWGLVSVVSLGVVFCGCIWLGGYFVFLVCFCGGSIGLVCEVVVAVVWWFY